MKKFLAAFFVFIVMPALVLLYFAMKPGTSRPEPDRKVQEVNTSSQDDDPAYITGEPEPLLRSPLEGVSVSTGLDENGSVYYTVTDSSGLPLLDRSYIGVTTDIRQMQSVMSSAGRYYDMNGRPLNAKPTHEGIYLHNGKKLLVK